MVAPTQKQIDYATSLGINAEGFDKATLSKAIEEKLGKEESTPAPGFEPGPASDVPVSMILAYAKDLAVAGKIDVNQIRAFTQEFLNICREVK